MKTLVSSESNRTLWCGPYALAVVSGLGYDEVYTKALRKIRRDTPRYCHQPKYIKGMAERQVEAVAKVLKVPCKFNKVEGLRRTATLNSLLDYLRPNRIYIVGITDHYAVVNTATGMLIDNIHKEWVPVGDSKHARCRVEEVAEVKRHKVF